MSLQNVLHAALFGYKRYILLVSDTEAQAVSFLDAIKNELETNERILADFGEQPGKTWKTGSILLSNGCRIDAVGSGQKLRGRRNYERRPDLILCDDIENDEGVRTAEQRQKDRRLVLESGLQVRRQLHGHPRHRHHPAPRFPLAGLLENPGFQSRKYRAVLSDATSPYGRTGSASPRISPTPTGKKPPTPSISSTARKCWQAPKSSGRKNSATTICGSCG